MTEIFPKSKKDIPQNLKKTKIPSKQNKMTEISLKLKITKIPPLNLQNYRNTPEI